MIVSGTFVLSSGLGFVLLAIVARWLSPEQNAQFLAVWALVFGIGGAMSAVDAETSRIASRATLERRRVPSQVGLVTVVGAAGGAVLVLALTALPGVGDVVRASPATLAWTLTAVVLFAPLCMSRGVLLGVGRVRSYAAVVLGEALLRAALALGLWVGSQPAQVPAAVATIAIGGLAWVPVSRLVVRAVDWRDGVRSLRSALRAVGALGSANALSALLLAGYPALVTTVAGSTRDLQVLFAALVLTRLPLVVIAPLQAVAVPLATRALHSGQLDLLRRLWAQGLVLVVALAAAAATVGWYLGPWAISLFQGPGYDASPLLMAVLLAATCVMAGGLPQLAVMVAADKHGSVTLVWVVAVGTAAAWLSLGPGTTETRGMVGYAAASVVVYAASSVGLLSATAGAPGAEHGEETAPHPCSEDHSEERREE